MANRDRLLGLIEAAYDASQDPSAWARLLTELAGTLNGNAAVIVQHDLAVAGHVAAFAHMNPDAISAYDQHFHRLDPFAAPLKRAGAETHGGVFAGDLLVDRSAFLRSEFGNDFGLRFGVTQMMTVVTPQGANSSGPGVTAITVMRPDGHESFGTTEARLLRRLLPHVSRALEVGRRLQLAAGAEQASRHALDLVQSAAYVVDRRGALLRANASGESLLRQSRGLTVKGGRLEAFTATDTAALIAACDRTADASGAASRGTTLVMTGTDGLHLRVVAAPVSVGHGPWADLAPGAVLLLVEPLGPGPLPRVDLLIDLYGLTRAEAEVTARLVRGDSLEDIARARRYTIDTVRWYSKQVLAKCGCSSRVELVRRLSLGPASLLAGSGTAGED